MDPLTKINEIANQKESDPVLFISNLRTAAEITPKDRIDVVINVCEDDHMTSTKNYWEKEGIAYYHFPIEDDEDQELINSACLPIHEIIRKSENQNILIHCQAGISRSVS